MKYFEMVTLKNGVECCLRHGEEADGQEVYENFNLTHGQTDFLLSYPDENSMDAIQEGEFLKKKMESDNEVEILAVMDGRVVGTAGIDAVGSKYKVKHRAEVGISIDQEFWGIGIGKKMMEACIKCAREAGYIQLELDAVAQNARAIPMYEALGFREFGRNPKGFRSRTTGFQELVYMRLEL